MPLLSVRVPPPSPIPVNTYEQTVTDLGASHFWQFDEMTGNDFSDSIGNLDFRQLRGNGVGRGFPGPTIGAPYLPALENGPFNSSANGGRWITADNSLAQFDDTQTTGAFGGFFKLGLVSDGTGNGLREGFHCFYITFNNNTGLCVFVMIRTNGAVRVLVDAGGSRSARWDTTSTPFADQQWHQLVVSQPGDGTGVDIWVDGVAQTVTQTLGSDGSADYWVNDAKNAAFSPPANRTLTNITVGGRGLNNDGDRIQGTKWSGLFWITNGSLTQQNVTDIYDSTNAGLRATIAATSYEEYMLKVFGLQGALIWPYCWFYNSSTVGYNYGATIPDFNSANTGYVITGDSGTFNLQPLPAELSGIKYGKHYGQFSSSAGTGVVVSSGATASWDSRSDTEGTLFVICEVPSGSSTDVPVQFFRGSGGPSRLFDVLRISFVGSSRNVRVDLWGGNTFGVVNNDGDGWQLNTTNITSPWVAGDIISIAVVQPGDGSGPTLYINGDPASNVNFALAGTATNDAWHADISTTQFSIGSGEFASPFDAEIYDVWYDDSAITAQQVKNLHDLAFGNIQIAS